MMERDDLVCSCICSTGRIETEIETMIKLNKNKSQVS